MGSGCFFWGGGGEGQGEGGGGKVSTSGLFSRP